jgi:hypothetical protein
LNVVEDERGLYPEYGPVTKQHPSSSVQAFVEDQDQRQGRAQKPQCGEPRGEEQAQHRVPDPYDDPDADSYQGGRLTVENVIGDLL